MASNPIMNMDTDVTFFITVTVPDVECNKIKVTGSDDYLGCNGTYFVTAEKSTSSPTMPVYKKHGYDRFIYHSLNRGFGWRISDYETLSPGENEGKYTFKGKSFSKESLIEFYISHIQYAYVLKIQNLIFKATMRMTQNLGRLETSGIRLLIHIKFVWNVYEIKSFILPWQTWNEYQTNTFLCNMYCSGIENIISYHQHTMVKSINWLTKKSSEGIWHTALILLGGGSLHYILILYQGRRKV